APIDARFAATRSSCHPPYVHLTCNAWYNLELGDRCPQAWVSLMVVDGELVVDVVDGSKDVERLCLDARWCNQESRVHIELGVQGSESTPSSRFHKLPGIESSRLVHEPIRFYSDFKFNVQNTLRVDSSSSESIPMSDEVILKNDSMTNEVITSHVYCHPCFTKS
ncbi:hypothetical protein PIB30_075564, partial [Stylosanthes scabra]|nr:hypothetical protein [Stylosanthes scabra]